MINLRYCLYSAHKNGQNKKPSDVIDSLGIKFERWIPQTAGDQIWLHGCTNVPSKLPPYITVKD